MKIRLIAIALSSLVVSCASFFSPAMKIYNTPFAAGRRGGTASISFEVPTTEYVGFYLSFNNMTDLLRMGLYGEVIGRWGNPKPAGTDKNGIAIPVSITVWDEGSTEVLRHEVEKESLESAGNDSVTKEIIGLVLHPGQYRAEITALRNICMLDRVSVDLQIRAPSRK